MRDRPLVYAQRRSYNFWPSSGLSVIDRQKPASHDYVCRLDNRTGLMAQVKLEIACRTQQNDTNPNPNRMVP